MLPSRACSFFTLSVSLLAADAQLPPAQPRELSQEPQGGCAQFETSVDCNAQISPACYWVKGSKCLAACPHGQGESSAETCACGYEEKSSLQWCNYTNPAAPRRQALCGTFDCKDPDGDNHGWMSDHASFSKVCRGEVCDFSDRVQCCKAIECWRDVVATYDQTGKPVLKFQHDDDMVPVDKFRINDAEKGAKLQPVMMSAGQKASGLANYVVACYPSPGGSKKHGDTLWSVNTGKCLGTLQVPDKFSWFGDNEKKKQIKQQKRNARRLSSVKRR